VIEQSNILKVFENNEEKSAFWSIDFSSNGQFLVTSGEILGHGDSGIFIWDLKTLEVIKSIEDNPFVVRFSPDDRYLAWKSDKNISLLELETGNKIALEGHQDEIRTFVFSPDSKFLASGGRDCQLRIWDIKSSEIMHVLEGADRTASSSHGTGIYCAAFTPNGELIATGGADNALRFWEVKSGREQFVLKTAPTLGKPEAVYSVAFNPNEHILAIGTEQSEIQIWDWKTRTKRLDLYKNPIGRTDPKLLFSPNGSLLVGRVNPGVLLLWGIGDLINGQEGYKLKISDEDEIWDIAFSPSGNLLASAHGKNARLWNIHIV
jgi:WD40 repeat protein